MEKKQAKAQRQLPAILRRNSKLVRRLPSAERKRAIEKHLTSDIPQKHEIVGMLSVMDKDLDLVDERLQKTVDHSRDVVLNAMKGKLYNMQKEIRELEEKTEKEAVQRRIDEEIRMLNNDIEQIRVESTKLEDKRRTLDSQLKKLDSNNKIIEEEERFLTSQISRAQSTQKTLTERISQLEAPAHRQNPANGSDNIINVNNMSQLSASEIIPAEKKDEILKDLVEDSSAAVLGTINESTDYVAARQRYERRIKLVEKRIEELKVDNRLKQYKHVRSTNPVEEAFEDVVAKMKGEVVRRKAFSFRRCDRSLKISQSQPTLLLRKDISVQFEGDSSTATQDAGAVNLNLFTDTDKIRAIEGFLAKPKVREFMYKLLFPEGTMEGPSK